MSGFRSHSECQRFVTRIDEQVRSAVAVGVPVEKPYIGATTFREKWFRHTASGKTWRMVWPGAPVTESFEPAE
jgi:hypothetical protein